MDDKKEDINAITDLLEQTQVKNENIITFKGRALKLNNKEDAMEVIEAINNCKDLQVLELVGNTVGVDAAELIGEALKEKPELERCLWADMFTGRLRSEIPKSLHYLGDGIIAANSHLVELDLSDNAFGADCVKACVDLLRSPSAFTLQDLKFNNNGLGGGGIILAETLIECHERSSEAGKPLALKTFVAGRNRLENPGATALGKAFALIGTLEEIHLPQNGIQKEGIAALAEAVKINKNLRHLNLNDNSFTEKGAVAMAEGIENIDSLKIINFGDCLVRTNGAKALAKALKNSNPGLEQLILSGGEVQLEGGLKICEALADKEALQKVDLNENQFGEDGVNEIKDLADENHFAEALCSLSDDEGSDEDEESDHSEEEHEQSGILNGVSNGTIREQSLLSTDDSLNQSLTAENFLSLVTPLSIVAMSEEFRAELLDEVVDSVPNADATAKALAKLAGLLDDSCTESLFSSDDVSTENLRSAVFQCVDVLAADALEKYPNTPMIVFNAILVEMGLVKSEDKKHRPVEDVRGLTVVLGHVCQQPYFPKFIKSVVRSIVAKDNKVWAHNASVLRSQLLQLLYA